MAGSPPAPGGSYPGTFNTTLPTNISGSNFFLALSVDATNKLGELDETNNVLYVGPFTIGL